MSVSVPVTSSPPSAELKDSAGGGLASTESKRGSVSLSVGLKEEILKIINKYAKNKSSLTHEEFLRFLKEEQQVLPGVFN